jgi:hypothetical protein
VDVLGQQFLDIGKQRPVTAAWAWRLGIEAADQTRERKAQERPPNPIAG